MGRREPAARARIDQAHVAGLAAEIPPEATAFLSQLLAMQEALRAPDSPGAAYLRGRGLDPLLAADLGAGYAAPNHWPGDRGRAVGRIVYPLADPATGRVVSALGRLCRDADPTWSEALQADFKDKKQRTLKDCPAGVWPYQSIADARGNSRPLVLVEGPADALAALQAPGTPLDVVGLCGTAHMVTAAVITELVGVVFALDADAGGSKGTKRIRLDVEMSGVLTVAPPAGWLGRATDLADAAKAASQAGQEAGAAGNPPGSATSYQSALQALHEASATLQARVAARRSLHRQTPPPATTSTGAQEGAPGPWGMRRRLSPSW